MSISASSVTGDCTGLGLWLLVRGLSAPAHIDAGLVLSLSLAAPRSGCFVLGTELGVRLLLQLLGRVAAVLWTGGLSAVGAEIHKPFQLRISHFLGPVTTFLTTSILPGISSRHLSC